MAIAEPRPVPPLVERGPELERLVELATAATAGDGRVVLVEAEPGAGRSALLSALREQLDSTHRVLLARGSELERDHAFGIVRQLLEPLTVGSPDLLSGPAELAIPTLRGGPDADDRPTFAVLHSLYWLTSNLAEDAPLVLSIDDAHVADADSLRFVDYLATRLEGLRVLIVLTRARGPAPTPDLERVAARAETERLPLAGLSRPGSATLVRHWLGESAPDPLCSACHDATGGIPLLLRELARELARGEGARSAPAKARSLAPPAIVAIVRRRLDGLSAEAGRLARALAVLGPAARLSDAARVAELDEAHAATAGDELAAAGLMDGVDAVRPLVFTALKDALGRGERDALHRRAAMLLLRDDPDRLDDAAAHLLASAPGGQGWVAGVLRDAAARARSHGATETAVNLLRRAQLEPPPSDQVPLVALELAEATYTAGAAEAVALAEAALALQTDPDLRLRAALVRGHALTLIGRAAEASAEIVAALEHAGDEALAKEAEALLLAWSVVSTAARAVVAARTAAATQAAEVLGDRAPAMLLAIAALERATTEGEADRALDLARRGWARREEVPSMAPFESFWVMAAATAGALADAEAWATGVAERGAASAHIVMYVAAALRGWVRLLRGDLPGAEADAWAAKELIEHTGAITVMEPLVAAVAAEVEAARGELESARRLLDGVPRTARSAGMNLTVRWRETSGRLHLAEGDPSGALEDADALASWAGAYGAKHSGWCAPDALAAEAWVALGDPERAAMHAAEALVAARAFRGPIQEGIALRAAALASGGAGARLARFDEAVERFDAAGAELWAARTRVDQGAALTAAGEPAEAPLRRALEWADEAGATAVRDAAADSLRAGGHDPGAPSRRATHALTPAERRVVEFAAAGLDPRAIAQRLMLTPATVGRRLASARVKLDQS
ncbi:MAG: hypothetical protein QOE86_4587 [Solirubrobacteraceae bacterium]|nr:hypothetical protein [Solirubrobacteraceae bacterium]